MVKVKICGITDAETALAATEAGADMLGLVFAPSKRRVSLQRAREISQAVRSLGNAPELVGVFAGAPADEVNRAAHFCLLDRVQLSSGEGWDYCRRIDYPIIKAIHIGPDTNVEQALAQVEVGYSARLEQSLVCLLDTKDNATWGGTGKKFDWRLAREVCRSYPVMVAGGLAPDNVGELLGAVRPWGVDVSSGVETDGVKDISKIKTFITAVRQAEKR